MWKKRVIKILVIIVLLFCGYIIFVSNFSYSDGSRTGYLSKFSKRGYVFKTYEGEIFLGGATAENNTVMNTTWAFSVRSGDKEAIASLEKYEGNIIKVHYKQVIKNMPWQGETNYFVYKVDVLEKK